MADAATAYWNQRTVLAANRQRILDLVRAVGRPVDLSPSQWAQLMAFALDFRPDLIIELGRGWGNSTCAFGEVARLMAPDPCRVISLCMSDDWKDRTAANVRPLVDDAWFGRLRILTEDILRFDFAAAVAGAKRVLLFWDAHGFEIAECVLGGILPLIADRPHAVVMHDMSDARYGSPTVRSYNGRGIWKGNNWSGPRLLMGHIDSAVEQSVSIIDFTSRNGLELHSGDHDIATRLAPDKARTAEMAEILGPELWSAGVNWFWFSLNEAPGPYHFPKFVPPPPPAPQAGAQADAKPFTLSFWKRIKWSINLLIGRVPWDGRLD